MTANRPGIYIAAPLFSAAERVFNRKLKEILETLLDVYLPQEDGGLFVEMVHAGAPVERAAREIFESDLAAIDLLIVLDGRTVDEGAAFELGYAFSRGKRCVALQTDMRRLLPIGNNPMITGALLYAGEDVCALMEWLRRDIDPTQRESSEGGADDTGSRLGARPDRVLTRNSAVPIEPS